MGGAKKPAWASSSACLSFSTGGLEHAVAETTPQGGQQSQEVLHMNTEKKPRKRLYSLAAAIGLALGTMGVAAAASTPSQPASAVTTAQQQSTASTTDKAATSADQTTEAESSGSDEVQDPTLSGSIQAPESTSGSEADEATALEALATISSSDAESAALAAVPGGTVNSVEPGNENGSVVYQVDMTDAAGQAVEVKVDAGSGDVLSTAAADNEVSEAEGSDTEAETSGDEATDGVDHQFEGEEVGNNGDGIPDANEGAETEAGTNG